MGYDKKVLPEVTWAIRVTSWCFQPHRVCVPVPLYHCFGNIVGGIAQLYHGGAVVFPSFTFEAPATMKAVEEERCSNLHGTEGLSSSERCQTLYWAFCMGKAERKKFHVFKHLKWFHWSFLDRNMTFLRLSLVTTLTTTRDISVGHAWASVFCTIIWEVLWMRWEPMFTYARWTERCLKDGKVNSSQLKKYLLEMMFS